MRTNLGKTDRILRFALAVWWLGPWKLQFTIPWANWLVLIIGWIALIESFIGYCWLHELLGINNKNQ